MRAEVEQLQQRPLLLLTLLLLTAGVRTEPCVNDAGIRYSTGAYYFEDAEKCIINQCIDYKETFYMKKCQPNTETPSDNDPVCTDPEGNEYSEGEQWWQTPLRPCERYECQSGQPKLLYSIPCDIPHPSCSTRQIHGQCCPEVIDCPDSGQRDCTYKFQTYQHNETWGDECTVHFCRNGQVISQFPDCPPSERASCAPIEQKDSCCVRWQCNNVVLDGTCKLGNRDVICFRPNDDECLKLDKTVLNQCCPVYKCFQGCYDTSGAYQPHGTSWQHNCSLATCDNGQLRQNRIECPLAQNVQCRRTNPEECCAVHDCDCEYKGSSYKNGQQWENSCKQLSCEDGYVQTSPVQCAEAPREDCTPKPFYYGQCCPTYECSCAAVFCPASPGPQCRKVGQTPDKCCDLYSCPGDCRDDEGRVHREGSEWYIKCTKYRCSEGLISEVVLACPSPPMENCKSIYLEGQCCPIYDCPINQCNPGDRTFDGCNFCECVSPGQFYCTLIACDEVACTFGDDTYQHGEVWTGADNFCHVYNCGYGIVLSKLLVCPPKPGPLCAAIAVDGQCCPEWDCDGQACPDNFTDTTWHDECNVCTCHSGVPLCTEHLCPRQCEVNGTVYESGTPIIGDNECDKALCINGIVIPDTEECHKPPFENCTDVLQPEEGASKSCCPDWICPNVPGWPEPCVVGSIHQTETECLFCQCLEREEEPTPFCTKRDCTQRGCTDGGVYHDHGEIWPTPNPCKHKSCINGDIQYLETQCTKPENLSDICRPIPDDERCCPAYHCSEECDEGETWMVDCNSCFCKSGLPVCTKKACPECEEGDIWQDECNTCTCVGGKASCTEKLCDDQRCTEGQEKTDNCNSCLCMHGFFMCSNITCDQDGTGSGDDGAAGTCPVRQSALIWPHRHPSAVCFADSQCGVGGYIRCCGRRCTAVDHKPGQCPPAGDASSKCHYRPGTNCHADHQCPGAYKCCRLGCNSFCVSPHDGSVLSF